LCRFFDWRPLDCKDRVRAFPKRDLREKPKGNPGVSTALFPRIRFDFWGYFFDETKLM